MNNNNKQTKYILFYSNRCNHCENFINQLNKNHIRNDFDFICIDNNYQNIPPTIKSVPTVILKESNNILIGKSIFNWLNEMTNQNNNQNQQQQQVGEPMAWHGNEMGCSYSDNYSFLDSDVSAQGSGGSLIAHNFSFISDNAQNNTQFPQNNQTEHKEKDELTKNMERMMAQRDQEVSGPVQRF